MSIQPLPKGLWPVMLTAFNKNGSISWSGVEALTEWYISRGSTGLFACCGASEMFKLTDSERLDLTRCVVNQADGRVPVVSTGTFGGSIDDQASFVRRMADTGVQAVVIIVSLMARKNEEEEILNEEESIEIEKFRSEMINVRAELRKVQNEPTELEDLEMDQEDDFDKIYKGEISKSGAAILPSKRVRKIPEKITVSKIEEEKEDKTQDDQQVEENSKSADNKTE